MNDVRPILIDLLEDLFAELGVTPEPVSLPWARAMQQMQTGALDLIGAPQEDP